MLIRLAWYDLCTFNNNFLTFAYTLDTIEQKLISMDIELPNPAPPAGSYVQTVKTGNLVFVAGHSIGEMNYFLIVNHSPDHQRLYWYCYCQ